MSEFPRREVLALGAAVGSLGASGCLTAISTGNGKPGDERATDEVDIRDLTLSKGGPGTLADASEVHSGWVHLVAHGDAYDLTFDVRIEHGWTEEVQVSLRGIPGGEYDLAFGTTEASGTPSGSADADDRAFGTRVRGSGTLPTDFESLRVTAGGETLRTVDNERTMPVMRPLPDPIARD